MMELMLISIVIFASLGFTLLFNKVILPKWDKSIEDKIDRDGYHYHEDNTEECNRCKARGWQ